MPRKAGSAPQCSCCSGMLCLGDGLCRRSPEFLLLPFVTGSWLRRAEVWGRHLTLLLYLDAWRACIFECETSQFSHKLCIKYFDFQSLPSVPPSMRLLHGITLTVLLSTSPAVPFRLHHSSFSLVLVPDLLSLQVRG